jgi:hypothetical protein
VEQGGWRMGSSWPRAGGEAPVNHEVAYSSSDLGQQQRAVAVRTETEAEAEAPGHPQVVVVEVVVWSKVMVWLLAVERQSGDKRGPDSKSPGVAQPGRPPRTPRGATHDAPGRPACNRPDKSLTPPFH